MRGVCWMRSNSDFLWWHFSTTVFNLSIGELSIWTTKTYFWHASAWTIGSDPIGAKTFSMKYITLDEFRWGRQSTTRRSIGLQKIVTIIFDELIICFTFSETSGLGGSHVLECGVQWKNVICPASTRSAKNAFWFLPEWKKMCCDSSAHSVHYASVRACRTIICFRAE
jgi:hypothetical protein